MAPSVKSPRKTPQAEASPAILTSTLTAAEDCRRGEEFRSNKFACQNFSSSTASSDSLILQFQVGASSISRYRARVTTLTGCPRALTPAWSLPTTEATSRTLCCDFLREIKTPTWSRILATFSSGNLKTIFCVSKTKPKYTAF